MKVYTNMVQVESLTVDTDAYKWFWFVHQPYSTKSSVLWPLH